MNKLVKILVIILLVMILVVAGTVGFLWYRDTHVFVEGKPYPISATELDLREKEISFEHYDSLHAQLPGCHVIWNVPFQGAAVPSNAGSITLKGLNEEDLRILTTYFADLTSIDASGVNAYGLLAKLQEAMPETSLTYTVSLGKEAFAPDVTELVLASGDYDFETLKTNLQYLPRVKSLQLRTPELTLEQVEELKKQYDKVDIFCTVDLLGQEYDTETTELDLSALTSEDVASTLDKLGMLPGLTYVELNDSEGNSILTKEDVKAMMEALPEVTFNYTFDFYGVKISTADEEVVIKNKKIGDEGQDEVRAALDLLKHCKRFVLDNCRLSGEVLSEIREEYRDQTKVVWRVYFGEGTSMTDAEILRSTYNVTDDNCHDLIYCEDIRYMDLGHNDFLDAIPFVAGMPNLEVVIVSGAPIKDLTPFENCKKLRILEIANCMYIKDATPLAQCTALEMLNISYTGIRDLSPLDDLKLTHLTAVPPRIPIEERERYEEAHPDCWTTFGGTQPYGRGWRYDGEDKPLAWYEDITHVFRYPHAPNNVGWYLDK